MRMIAEATHVCGDPGMQFDTTINEWHTCPNTDRINASNPCSEYMFLDDSACNLASINLMKFVDARRRVRRRRRSSAAVRTLITAQEIIVDNASYPTKAIEQNSHDYRPLGLGYANLGALLMSRGLPYDSDAGRALRGGDHRADDRRGLRAVGADRARPRRAVRRLRAEPRAVPPRDAQAPRRAAATSTPRYVPDGPVRRGARQAWDEAVELGEEYGYRNAQATVLAPTGTIGFMMDCDTTGVEPDIALVKYKKLVGGGLMKIVNQTVPAALAAARLHASRRSRRSSTTSTSTETIEGAPHLKEKDLPVFDCAFKPAKGQRVDPLHGPHQDDGRRRSRSSRARSPRRSTCPKDATVDDIMQAYIEAWRLGVKAIAIYRDGSKRTQPLNTSKATRRRRAEASSRRAVPPAGAAQAARRAPGDHAQVRHRRATRATSPSASTRTACRARSSS